MGSVRKEVEKHKKIKKYNQAEVYKYRKHLKSIWEKEGKKLKATKLNCF